MSNSKLPENIIRFNIYIDKDVKKKIEELAKQDNRSCSNLINHLIKTYIKDTENK